MPIIECERCGEDSDLRGEQTGSGIQITCNACGHAWLRDTQPMCASCGSRQIRAFKEPLVQRARGTAHSIVGQKTVYLCERCDAEEIERRHPAPETGFAPREDPWK